MDRLVALVIDRLDRLDRQCRYSMPTMVFEAVLIMVNFLSQSSSLLVGKRKLLCM